MLKSYKCINENGYYMDLEKEHIIIHITWCQYLIANYVEFRNISIVQ